jgi:hypothetical protein
METKKIVLLCIAGFLILFSIYFFFTQGSGPKVDLDPYLCIADGMAAETKKVLGGGGSIVFITQEDADLYKQRNQRFEKMLKKEGVTIAAKELLTESQLYEGADEDPRISEQISIPVDRFLAYLEKYPSVQGFVSFVGPPALLEEHLEKIPAENGPKIIVFGHKRIASGLGVKELLLAGKIHAAVYPRSDGGHRSDKKSSGMLDVFEKYYQVFTPENAESFEIQY